MCSFGQSHPFIFSRKLIVSGREPIISGRQADISRCAVFRVAVRGDRKMRKNTLTPKNRQLRQPPVFATLLFSCSTDGTVLIIHVGLRLVMSLIFLMGAGLYSLLDIHIVTVIDTIVETVGVRVSYALFYDGVQIFLGKTVFKPVGRTVGDQNSLCIGDVKSFAKNNTENNKYDQM